MRIVIFLSIAAGRFVRDESVGRVAAGQSNPWGAEHGGQMFYLDKRCMEAVRFTDDGLVDLQRPGPKESSGWRQYGHLSTLVEASNPCFDLNTRVMVRGLVSDAKLNGRCGLVVPVRNTQAPPSRVGVEIDEEVVEVEPEHLGHADSVVCSAAKILLTADEVSPGVKDMLGRAAGKVDGYIPSSLKSVVGWFLPSSVKDAASALFTGQPASDAVVPAHPRPRGKVWAAKVLGVPAGASRKETEAAFRRLARDVHPDEMAGRPAEIQEAGRVALQVLMDAKEILLADKLASFDDEAEQTTPVDAEAEVTPVNAEPQTIPEGPKAIMPPAGRKDITLPTWPAATIHLPAEPKTEPEHDPKAIMAPPAEPKTEPEHDPKAIMAPPAEPKTEPEGPKAIMAPPAKPKEQMPTEVKPSKVPFKPRLVVQVPTEVEPTVFKPRPVKPEAEPQLESEPEPDQTVFKPRPVEPEPKLEPEPQKPAETTDNAEGYKQPDAETDAEAQATIPAEEMNAEGGKPGSACAAALVLALLA